MLRQGAPAPEFTDAASLQAHYRALRERTWMPRAIAPRPIRTRSLTLAEVRHERELRERAEREAAALADRERVRELAAQVLTPEHLARDPRHIITEVAEAFGYSHADIVGPGRSAALVRARWAAIAAVRAARPDLSLNRLGRTFGHDHTTIRHALRTMAVEGVPQPPSGGPDA